MYYLKIIFIIPIFSVLLLISPNISHSMSDSHMPYWHYNDAKWWSEGKISNEKFLDSIIVILDESKTLQNTGENKIPLWFSIIATWFSNYEINQNEYKLIIEYLHSQNILQVSEPLISSTLQDYTFNTFPLIQTFEKDVTLFEVGNYFKDKVYKTVIQRNVRLSEAPSHGMPVLIYDKSCPGSKSYFSFTDEFINQESTVGSAA